MPVPILKQGPILLASVQTALSDADWRQLLADLGRQVGLHRSRGVILDVAGLDVLDSYAARSLDTIARTLKLRGAQTLIVGIQPDVAFAMVQLGLVTRLGGIDTALDLEDGLALLRRKLGLAGANPV